MEMATQHGMHGHVAVGGAGPHGAPGLQAAADSSLREQRVSVLLALLHGGRLAGLRNPSRPP